MPDNYSEYIKIYNKHNPKFNKVEVSAVKAPTQMELEEYKDFENQYDSYINKVNKGNESSENSENLLKYLYNTITNPDTWKAITSQSVKQTLKNSKNEAEQNTKNAVNTFKEIWDKGAKRRSKDKSTTKKTVSYLGDIARSIGAVLDGTIGSVYEGITPNKLKSAIAPFSSFVDVGKLADSARSLVTKGEEFYLPNDPRNTGLSGNGWNFLDEYNITKDVRRDINDILNVAVAVKGLKSGVSKGVKTAKNVKSGKISNSINNNKQYIANHIPIAANISKGVDVAKGISTVFNPSVSSLTRLKAGAGVVGNGLVLPLSDLYLFPYYYGPLVTNDIGNAYDYYRYEKPNLDIYKNNPILKGSIEDIKSSLF